MIKTVIIINGAGGVGKNTLCDITDKYYSTFNTSAITPIKEIAKQLGWDGQKEAKDRKLLADLKQPSIEYNDLPTKYLYEQFEKFVQDEFDQIMFMHIREPEEIDKIKDKIKETDNVRVITLLVKRDSTRNEWGNEADDSVAKYSYDFTYNNNKELKEVEGDFIDFLQDVIKIEGENDNS